MLYFQTNAVRARSPLYVPTSTDDSVCQRWHAVIEVTRRNTSSFQKASLWFDIVFRHQLTASGDWDRSRSSVTSRGSFQESAPSVTSRGSFQGSAPSVTSSGSFQTNRIPLIKECLSIIYNRKHQIHLPSSLQKRSSHLRCNEFVSYQIIFSHAELNSFPGKVM